MKPSIRLVVAAMALAAGSGALLAQTNPPQGYYGYPTPPYPPPGWLAEGRSVDAWDRYRYDESGTRGRMGLGASPMHPEGPGNFSTPGR
ncbi:hypothetical protein [Methylocapsa aurea]|uniref:hypothetical protein n=1 Tax=Methylocapsa aurea TaxID=663610 RepID=UPI000568BA90|nr:hypothetical protein [Methylocapsa aurea]